MLFILLYLYIKGIPHLTDINRVDKTIFKFKIKHCKVRLAHEHCTIASFSVHLHFYPIKRFFRFQKLYYHPKPRNQPVSIIFQL